MSSKLCGKRAIVTGAGNGIGHSIADLFVENGASVLAVDMSGEDLEQRFAAVESVSTLVADVAADAAPATIVNAAIERLGGIDILVNNAGIVIAGQFEELTDEQFDTIMGVNVRAMFRISREAIPHLRESGRGRIINLGSIMSDLAGPALSIYGTSKHAVAGLTKGMAVDLGPYGITVNYLQPGSIVTKMSEPFMNDPEFKQYWEDKAPIGRLGEPDEVAEAALFLASDEAQFVSGVGLNVDGGAIVKF
jgi:NAD(P)-dependent dehydrogenase (short-subunit alcohol dehydrogenase family)